ncbi:protein co-occurring with transport systems [Salmonella enterica]|nr:protein co-occurring with transport systems [Salmonella enterica]
MRATIVWRGWRGRRTTHSNWAFQTTANRAGTAGKPMLAQLMGSGVGEITAVVVRYYGGILLGTGGLVKAYGGRCESGITSACHTTQDAINRIYFAV